MKKPTDNPTIGLLLCKEKNQLIAEWALSDIHKPIGVSEYQLTKHLPTELQSKLPTVEQIESELEDDLHHQLNLLRTPNAQKIKRSCYDSIDEFRFKEKKRLNQL